MNMELPLATASAMFPGFRFSPTDEELISYYLKKKVEEGGSSISSSSLQLISEVEIWKHEPWDLPAKSEIQSEKEWFFFSRRGRKYPNGSQSRRATESGYWKATGKERDVKSTDSGSNVIGTKRTLVFHIGRAPKGQRTPWIMHEYSIINPTKSQLEDSMVVCRLRKNNEFQLNETTTRPQENNLNTTTLCEADRVESSCGGNAAPAGDRGSRESSGSLSSHSVEQIESKSESESDEKLMNEIQRLPPSEPHPQEPVDGDEEWFADIMNDDIVKLDDSTSLMKHQQPATCDEGLGSDNNPTSSHHHNHNNNNNNHLFPSQGTANRRLRLRIKEPTARGHPESPHQGRRCWVRCLFRLSRGRSSTMKLLPQHNRRQSNSPYYYYLMSLAILGLVIPMLFCCLG
ncbi:unnamed protein product [Cuscuta campestris]|uniref:NAC domain-containing protein n=1 Tax=Cuscuta campestris TaxID=132261 RepID=A0A484L557_9ASTE|nr:unnamed protein product [Cuscuta campestris]